MAKLTLKYAARSHAEADRLLISAARLPGAGAFEGRLLRPDVFRMCMLTLGEVVHANFEMLSLEEWYERILDPVVGIYSQEGKH